MNVPLRVVKTPAEAMLSEQYAVARGELPGSARVIELRDRAFRTIETQGLPNRRIEDWKYTDLRALMREAKRLAGSPSDAAMAAARNPSPFKNCGLREIVFFDGAFVPALSDLANLESGLSITPLSQALKSDHAVLRDRLGRLAPAQPNAAIALNTAFMSDGAVIHVAKGSRIERPVHLRFVRGGEANASFDRILLVVEEGAAVTLVKSFEGPDGVEYQTNTALEAFVGDRAQVRIDRLQDEGRAALHLSTLMVDLGKNAELSTMALTKGAAIARHQIYVTFRGEHAQAAIRGANLLNGDQHADTTMVVDHAAVHGASRETFKSVLEGRSRGVFQGKIIVQPHAQKTDGKMASHALLLSENAEMNNKPELEIFADDVQCGHGATVGSLNKDLLFYLKARGIPEKEAQALLIQSFVGEAIEGVEHEGVRDAMTEIVAKWLAART